MRAITVRQPWAWAIAVGDDGKPVENRSAGFPSSYRGPLLVHAAKERWAGACDLDHPAHRALADLSKSHRFADVRGAVIAVAELVDVHADGECCRPWGESAYTADDGKPRRGVVHLVLEDVRQVDEPVPCRGALGLWRPPADVIAAVEAQR